MLEKETWDFGVIKRGEVAHTKIRLFNHTPRDLRFWLYPSCDCLEAIADSDSLKAHSAIDISISFTGDEVKEKVTKTLYIDVFDHISQRLVVSVTGTIIPGDKPHLVVIPSPVLIESDDDSAYLQISNMGLEELIIFDIKGFGCTTDFRSLHLTSGETIEIRLSLVQGWRGNRWIEIESNDAVYPVKKVSVLVVR